MAAWPPPYRRPRITPDPGALDRLQVICRELSPVLSSAKIVARQACYRPITRDGLPLIGPVAGVEVVVHGAQLGTGPLRREQGVGQERVRLQVAQLGSPAQIISTAEGKSHQLAAGVTWCSGIP